MIVAKNGLKSVTRNTSYFQKFPNTDENIEDITDPDDEILEDNGQGILRRVYYSSWGNRTVSARCATINRVYYTLEGRDVIC